MIATQGMAGRAFASFAQQIGVSVLATLGATAVLAGLGALHLPDRASVAQPPSLTSGGKFAARAAGGDDANDLITLVNLPPVLPMFTAPAVPALDPAPAVDADGVKAPIDAPQRIVTARAGHPAGRRIAAAPLPPRRGRAAGIDVALAAPDLSPSPDASLWGRVKGAYGTVTGWSGAVLDHLMP